MILGSPLLDEFAFLSCVRTVSVSDLFIIVIRTVGKLFLVGVSGSSLYALRVHTEDNQSAGKRSPLDSCASCCEPRTVPGLMKFVFDSLDS